MLSANTLWQIRGLSPGELPRPPHTHPPAAPRPRERTRAGGCPPGSAPARTATGLHGAACQWGKPRGPGPRGHIKAPHPGLPPLVLTALILCQKLAAFCFN